MDLTFAKSLLKFSGLFQPKPPDPKQASPTIAWDQDPVQSVSVEALESFMRVDASRISSAFQAASEGDSRDQATIGVELLDKDSVTSAHWRTRRLAVTSCPWAVHLTNVQAGQEDEDARSKEITSALDASGMSGLIGQLIDAAWFGYSGCLVERNADGFPVTFHMIHPTRFVFDKGGNPAVVLLDGTEKALSALAVGQYVFCRPASSMVPQKAGILRNVAYQWLYRHNAWLWRAKYIERYGQPIQEVTVPAKQWGDKAELAKLRSSLDEMGARGRAIIPEGSALKLTSPTGAGQTDYDQFITKCNEEICLAILGQLASSDKAGGLSNGGGQENVRMDILASDCRMIEDAINTYIVKPYLRVIYGDSAVGKYKFAIDYSPPEDQEIMARVVKLIGDSGYVIDPGWLSEEFGIPVRMKTAAEQAVPQTKAISERSAFSDRRIQSPPGEAFIQQVTETTLRKLINDESGVQALLAPLRQIIDKEYGSIDSNDPAAMEKFTEATDRFLRQFPALYQAMGISSFGVQEAIRTAILSVITTTTVGE